MIDKLDLHDLKDWSDDALDEEIFEARQKCLEWLTDHMSHYNIVRDLLVMQEERANRNE